MPILPGGSVVVTGPSWLVVPVVVRVVNARGRKSTMVCGPVAEGFCGNVVMKESSMPSV